MERHQTRPSSSKGAYPFYYQPIYADRHHAVSIKHMRDHYKETGLRMAQFGKEA